MKIAFFTYPSAFQNVGGGEILLLKVKESLEKEGVSVDLFDMWHSKVEHYDLIHIFGSVKDCLGLAEVAKARNVKVALSPILWSDLRRAFHTDGSFLVKADFLARHVMKRAFPAFPSSRRRLLLCADLLFPNSEMEKSQMARLFAIPSERMQVVYNGVDPVFLNAEPSLFRQKVGQEPFLLGVGRIEPRKNQLNLIKAVKEIKGARLVLIGSPVSGYEAYYQKCLSEGQGFTQFIPTLGHEDPLLRSAYAACRLFVLPAWFETPGLAALEAGLAGARVVATSGGSTREYFQDDVDYIDPSSPADIRQKILTSLNTSQNGDLKKRILANYTWDKIAKRYIALYKALLENQ